MKTVLKKLFVIGACALHVSVIAGEAELQAANQLLDVLHFDEQMEYAVTCSVNLVKEMEDEFTQEQAQELKAFYEQYLFDAQFRNDIAGVYARVLTCEELQGLTAFYETEIGQKVLNQMPQLMQETMRMVQERLTQCMQESTQ